MTFRIPRTLWIVVLLFTYLFHELHARTNEFDELINKGNVGSVNNRNWLNNDEAINNLKRRQKDINERAESWMNGHNYNEACKCISEYADLLGNLFGENCTEARNQRDYSKELERIAKMAEDKRRSFDAYRKAIREGMRRVSSLDLDGAYDSFMEAHSQITSILDENTFLVCNSLYVMAHIQQARGNLSDATKIWEKLAKITNFRLGQHNELYARAMHNVAICRNELGISDGMEDLLHEIIGIYQNTCCCERDTEMLAHLELGIFYERIGKYAEAENETRIALRYYMGRLTESGDGYACVIWTHCELAKIFYKQRKYLDATSVSEKAIHIMETMNCISDRGSIEEMLKNYIVAEEEFGDKDKIEHARQIIRELPNERATIRCIRFAATGCGRFE